MTSQAIDTLLFIGIVFGIGFRWLWQPDKWPALAATIAGQYLFKIILAALDTPLFYLLTRRATAPKQRSETAEKPSDMKK